MAVSRLLRDSARYENIPGRGIGAWRPDEADRIDREEHCAFPGAQRLPACAGSLLLIASASAEDACGLCDKEIVTNSELATCFLDQYDQIAKSDSGAVVVDLSELRARAASSRRCRRPTKAPRSRTCSS